MQLIDAIAASRLATVAVVVALTAAAIAISVTGFGITVVGGLSLYFVIWWILLFAVLPFGVRSQAEIGDVVAGSEPGAPSIPALSQKAIWTTILSSVVFIAAVALFPVLAGL